MSGRLILAGKRFKEIIGRDPVLVILVVLAMAYFFLAYLTNPARPADVFTGFLGYRDTAQYPLGWFGFYDQGAYLNLAKTLADFNFAELSNTFSYGLGYPLVAVPALWLGLDTDPFVFFNLAAFVFTIFATYYAAKKLISPTAGLLAGFGLLFASPLIHYTDQPWNSTICLVAMSGILLLATVKKVTKWHALAAGFLVGWVLAARYVDVVWLGPLALSSLYRGNFKLLIKPGLFLGIGLMLWVAPVAYAHYKVFGSPLRTPYVNHLGLGGIKVSDQQLGAYSLGRVPAAATGMFLGPRLKGQPDTDRGFLINMFWVLAAIPGAVIVMRRSRQKLFFGVLIGGTVLAFVFYLSFRASTPYSLKYGVLHYFKMFWPGLVILAVAFFDRQFGRLAARAKPTGS